jgi:SSS family solute:Na+ symporter
MQVNLSTIDYAIIIGYFLIITFVNSFIKKTESGSKLENYFLAGRKLTLPLFVATLVSTWYGNLLGMGEIAFKHGLVMLLTQGIFWYFIYFFMAFFLVEKIHKSKLFSIPDQLEQSYDKRTALAGAVVNLLLLLPTVYIMSLGFILHWILGWNCSLCIVLCSLVPLFYMLMGGFKAVVYADFIQFIFMFIGIALVLPFAYFKYGGLEFLTSHVPAAHLSLAADWSWQLILAWLLIATWTLVHPSFYQRIFAAEDIKTAKHGVLWSIVFWFAFDVMISLIGLYAYAAMPEVDASLSLPIFATSILPVACKGIFLTGLIATVMSTLDSLSFSSAMSISYDIYRRLRPEATEQEVIKVNKIALVVTMALGLLIAIYFTSLLDLMYARGTLAISALLVPLMGSYFWRKHSSRAAFWSIILGLLGAIAGYLIKNYCAIDIEPIFLGLALSFLGFSLIK